MPSPIDPDHAVERHTPWLVGWFRARGLAPEECLELTQEVLLRFLRNLGSLRDPEAAPAWLVRTARDMLGRARPPRRLVTFDEREHGAAPDAHDSADQERNAALEHAVRELPDELQQVLLVRFTRGLTYEACAEVLGVARATVQSRLRRALTALRERLAKDPEGAQNR